MYLLKLTDDTGVVYATTEGTSIDFRQMNDIYLEEVASMLVDEALDTGDIYDVSYEGFADVWRNDATSVYSLVQVDVESGKEERAGFVAARNVTYEHRQAFSELREAVKQEGVTPEALYWCVDELIHTRVYLSGCGGEVDDLKVEVDEAIEGSDFEFRWDGCDYEFRRSVEVAAA